MSAAERSLAKKQRRKPATLTWKEAAQMERRICVRCSTHFATVFLRKNRKKDFICRDRDKCLLRVRERRAREQLALKVGT